MTPQNEIIMMVLGLIGLVIIHLDAYFQYLSDKWVIGSPKHFLVTLISWFSWFLTLGGIVGFMHMVIRLWS